MAASAGANISIPAPAPNGILITIYLRDAQSIQIRSVSMGPKASQQLLCSAVQQPSEGKSDHEAHKVLTSVCVCVCVCTRACVCVHASVLVCVCVCGWWRVFACVCGWWGVCVVVMVCVCVCV